MGIEKLLPKIVTVSKNLNTGEFSFECTEGKLTENEEKLFTEDSDIIILKNCYGNGVDYSKHGTKISEIVNRIPTAKRAYRTYKRSNEERKR